MTDAPRPQFGRHERANAVRVKACCSYAMRGQRDVEEGGFCLRTTSGIALIGTGGMEA